MGSVYLGRGPLMTPTNSEDARIEEWLVRDLPEHPDDAIDLDPRLPSDLQAELEQRLAQEELRELERQIQHAANDATAPPVMINRFRALEAIRGGIGLVIKAIDPTFKRFVAIKFWMRASPNAIEALREEAVALARLSHPNVLAVYEPDAWNTHFMITMEWIEGMDGHQWLKQPRSCDEVLEVFIPAGNGIAAAHDAGIQHGDIKPANILIGNDGRVVVIDFGVAEAITSSPDREATDKPAGTTGYMAPERLRGKRGDARSDQFSFCVMVWRAVGGQPPFAGKTGAELLESIERRAIREPPAGKVPDWLLAVLRKGLASDPKDRHPDMHALLEMLRAGASADERRRRRRWRRVFFTILTAVLLAIGVVAGALAIVFVTGTLAVRPNEPAETGTEHLLSRAENAALKGDGAEVVTVLNRMASLIPEMTSAELESAVIKTDRIATIVESTSPDYALTGWAFAEAFRIKLRSRWREIARSIRPAP